MRRTDFVSDLVGEIKRYFDAHGIRCTRGEPSSPVELLARYLYSVVKMIDARPRRVHCSAEFDTTLKTLDRQYVTPIEAIRDRLESGGDLCGFLSKRASDASFDDGLLSDFGVHHFHLGAKPGPGSR